MKGKIKRQQKVQELLFAGYTQQQIANELNLSISTIQRDTRKIRTASDNWLDNLARGEYIHIFRETLEGIRYDISTLLEMLQQDDVKKDSHLQLKIIKEISSQRKNYLAILSKSPLVWAFKKFVEQNSPHSISDPRDEFIHGN